MTSDLSVNLLIVDPDLEQRVLKVLELTEFRISGRFLSLHEIPESSSGNYILISTWDSFPLDFKEHDEIEINFLELQRKFLTTVLIGEEEFSNVLTLSENSLQMLPGLLSSVAPIGFNSQKSDDALQILGVAPRVGARMLRRTLELASSDQFLLFARKKSADQKVIYCSELDEECIAELFKSVFENKGRYTRQAVVITKAPQTRGALNRIKALERELQGLGISAVFMLPFDKRLQVDGELSKSGVRALSPLFDWIAKPN